MTEERKRVHLRDLFKTGKEVKFDIDVGDGEQEVVIWMRKPTAGQQDEALNKARGQQARRRSLYKDKDSDHYMAHWADVESLETKEELVEQLLKFDLHRIKSQAYNEVLYNPELAPKDEDGELQWGEQGQLYLDLLVAIQNRMEEILLFNDQLSEEDQNLAINLQEDDELNRLDEERLAFEQSVDDRVEELSEEFKVEHLGMAFENLQKLFMKKLVDTDTSLAWYEEYRKWMLFFACKDPDDRTKNYFSNPDEVMSLPGNILQVLEDQLNDLDKTGDTLKNSRSLQLSSNSSE